MASTIDQIKKNAPKNQAPATISNPAPNQNNMWSSWQWQVLGVNPTPSLVSPSNSNPNAWFTWKPWDAWAFFVSQKWAKQNFMDELGMSNPAQQPNQQPTETKTTTVVKTQPTQQPVTQAPSPVIQPVQPQPALSWQEWLWTRQFWAFNDPNRQPWTRWSTTPAYTNTQNQAVSNGMQQITEWKFDNLMVWDLAEWLANGQIKETDLTVLKQTNPTKYDQTLKLQKTIKMMRDRNVALQKKDSSWVVEQAKTETKETIDQAKKLPEVNLDPATIKSNDLVAVYDNLLNTPDINDITTKMSWVDGEITVLSDKITNLRDDIIKEFPTSLGNTAVDALMYDRQQDLTRELTLKQLQKSNLLSEYNQKVEKQKEKFGLISQLVQKKEDREYQVYLDNLNFEQQKSLATFNQQLSMAVPDNKTMEVWGKIVTFDRNGQVISSYDPENANNPMQYIKASWDVWWQCGKYVNDLIQKATWVRLFWDELSQKIAVTQRDDNILKGSSTGIPWSAIIMDTGARSKDGKINYWHVWMIVGVNQEKWVYIINQSNLRGDERVSTDEIKMNDPRIKWFYANDTMIWKKQKWDELVDLSFSTLISWLWEKTQWKMQNLLKQAQTLWDKATEQSVFYSAFINSKTADERKQINGNSKLVQATTRIQNLLDEYQKLWWDTWLMSGTAEEIANKVGRTWDKNLVKIATWIKTALDEFKRAKSWAALSEQEEKFYNWLFPSGKNQFDYNQALLDSLRSSVAGGINDMMAIDMTPRTFQKIFNWDISTSELFGGKPAQSTAIEDNDYDDFLRNSSIDFSSLSY